MACLGLLSAVPAFARADAADAPIATRQSLASSGVDDEQQLFTPDDLLLFEVEAEGRLVTDALPAYSALSGVYLPLGELARMLELAIVVDPHHARAEGWVLREERIFRLDVVARTARAGGRELRLGPQDAALAQGEIYVRTEILEELLPLRLKADVRSLLLDVSATEPLPFQARIEREARRQRLGFGRRGEGRDQTFIETPYALFTPPAVDLVVSGQQDSEGFRPRYDVRAAGDLAFAGFQGFVAGDDAGLTEARILLERKDPHRRSALIPGLSRISLGDTYTPSLPIGARSAGGRGIAFTTEDFQEIGAFDQIDLRGELETGWDVELYVDGVLRASQKEADTGQYEFRDVPLVVGLNVVRLVFYGPQGERREETRRLQVGGGGVRRGELLVKFGLVDEGVPVIDVGADAAWDDHDLSDGMDPDAREPFLQRKGLRAAGQLAYGVAAGTAVSAGFASFHDFEGNPVRQATIGANAALAGFAAQVDVAADEAGGSGASVGFAGRLRDVAVVARHAEFSGGFLDEGGSYGALEPVVRSTSLNLDYVLGVGSRSLPTGFRLNREEFADGAVHLLGTARASTSVGRFLVSGTVRYESERDDRGADDQLGAAVTASGLIDDRWRVRATAAWDRDAFAAVTLDRQWGHGHALRLGFAHRWGDYPATTFQASHVWRLRHVDVSLFGGYATADGEARFGIQVSTGLAFDGRAYRMVGPGAAAGGGMSVFAFVDSDGDGRWRPGEAPVPGLRVQGSRGAAATGDDGRALVTGLGDGARASVQMDTASIEDPYLAAPPSLLVIVPRPGRVAVAAFPLQQTGEVEIAVALVREGEPSRPLSAVRLQLTDRAGQVVAEGRTEFDGALILSGLRPGAFVLRIDPEQAAALGLALDPSASVVVPPGGGFIGQVAAQVRLGAPSGLAAAPPAPIPAQTLETQRAGAAEAARPHPALQRLGRLGRGIARLLAPLNPFRRIQTAALAGSS